MFIDLKLRSYFLEQGINRSAFREDKLYDYEVDLLFSMNQAGILEVHKKYSQNGTTNSTKASSKKKSSMTCQDCEKLIRVDMKLDLTKR